MCKKLASIGLQAGASWQPDKLDPGVRAAMQKGLEEARAEMKKRSEGGTDAGKFFGTRERGSTHYMDRAMGVYMGIFGNVPQVSVYLSMPTDAAGKPLDGSKGRPTPSRSRRAGSITMHSIPQRFLVENPIKRYSIGSSTPGLRMKDDGSLVICVSAMQDEILQGIDSGREVPVLPQLTGGTCRLTPWYNQSYTLRR